jgi:hypothetical protein
MAAVALQERPVTPGWLRDTIVYRYKTTGEGFVAQRDRARFWGLLKETARTALQITRRFDRVRDDYRDAYPRMVSDDYWCRQFERRTP